jgi:toxin ParE1/3/4
VRLIWSDYAFADRDRIFDYVEAQSPKAATSVDERLDAATRRLVDFPESGRPGRIAGTRELVVRRTPFVIAYKLTLDAIVILRVLHGAQRWPDELSDR